MSAMTTFISWIYYYGYYRKDFLCFITRIFFYTFKSKSASLISELVLIVMIFDRWNLNGFCRFYNNRDHLYQN